MRFRVTPNSDTHVDVQQAAPLAPLLLSASALAALACGAGVGFQLGHLGLLPRLLEWLPWIALSCVAASMILAIHPISQRQPRDSAIAICSAAFLIGAASFWSVGFSPRQIELGDRIAGAIPFNDAESYYDVMVQWPMQALDQFNARRPVYAALCAFQGWLSDFDLRTFLSLRAGLFALSMLALHLTLSNRINWWAASGTTTALIWLSNSFISSTLSEASGVTLCALAVAIALTPSTIRSFTAQAISCILISGSWVLRPVNPLFPFVMVLVVSAPWYGGRLPVARVLTLSLICALIMFALSASLNLAIAEHGSGVNSHFSHVVLGFAKGGSWHISDQDLDAELSGLGESAAARKRVEVAIQTICNDPIPALRWSYQQIQASTRALAGWITCGRSSSSGIGWLTVTLVFVATWLKRDTVCLIGATGILCLLSGAPVLWAAAGMRTSAPLWVPLMVSITIPALLLQSWKARRGVSPLSSVSTKFVLGTGALFAAFLGLACLYTVGSFQFNQQRVDRECVSVVFDHRPSKSGQWADSNTIKCRIDDAIYWLKRQGYKSTETFLAEHRRHVIRMYRQPTDLNRNSDGVLGNFVIECKETLPASAEERGLDYSFAIKRLP